MTMTLHEAITQSRLSLRQISRQIPFPMSPAAISRLANYGEYPTRRDVADVRDALACALSTAGVDRASITFPKPGLRPNYGAAVRRDASSGVPLERYAEVKQLTTEELDLMQLDRNVLANFGLRVNPFLNDIESDEDVFDCKGHQAVATAIRDAIEQRGFLAVCAPSGAGKTTIWDGIESEYGMRDDVAICKPLVKHKEKLSPEHLCRALIYGLGGDDVKIPREAEDRGRMLSATLRAIRTGTVDRKAVLYIDDAHFCSASVLRQLKTFFEEKIGRFRLLAIVLVGLQTLKTKLATFPEIGNRIRLVEVPPVPVREYLDHKFRRVGARLDQVFAPDGIDAFLDRFRAPKRPALGYPLIVNANCIRAMVKLYENGGQAGEKITREIVDALPGEQPARRAS